MSGILEGQVILSTFRDEIACAENVPNSLRRFQMLKLEMNSCTTC